MNKMDKKTMESILSETAKNIKTQDNLSTADPIFMIQERRIKTFTGLEKHRYFNSQSFFTSKAALQYINVWRHSMSEPRIYVESGYRNYEWQAIREFLKNYQKEPQE